MGFGGAHATKKACSRWAYTLEIVRKGSEVRAGTRQDLSVRGDDQTQPAIGFQTIEWIEPIGSGVAKMVLIEILV